MFLIQPLDLKVANPADEVFYLGQNIETKLVRLQRLPSASVIHW